MSQQEIIVGIVVFIMGMIVSQRSENLEWEVYVTPSDRENQLRVFGNIASQGSSGSAFDMSTSTDHGYDEID